MSALVNSIKSSPIFSFFKQDDATVASPPPRQETIQTSGSLDEGQRYSWPLYDQDTEGGRAEPVQPAETTDSAEAILDDSIWLLEVAAAQSSPEDVRPFVAAYRYIDWATRPADDFAQTVRLALRVGAHRIARECALDGSHRFPDHAELQRLARLLAPPEAKVIKSEPNTSWKHNKAWLQTHWHEYKGKWVALQNGNLLAVADNLDGLVAQLGEIKYTGILVTPVW